MTGKILARFLCKSFILFYFLQMGEPLKTVNRSFMCGVCVNAVHAPDVAVVTSWTRSYGRQQETGFESTPVNAASATGGQHRQSRASQQSATVSVRCHTSMGLLVRRYVATRDVRQVQALVRLAVSGQHCSVCQFSATSISAQITNAFVCCVSRNNRLEIGRCVISMI